MKAKTRKGKVVEVAVKPKYGNGKWYHPVKHYGMRVISDVEHWWDTFSRNGETFGMATIKGERVLVQWTTTNWHVCRNVDPRESGLLERIEKSKPEPKSPILKKVARLNWYILDKVDLFDPDTGRIGEYTLGCTRKYGKAFVRMQHSERVYSVQRFGEQIVLKSVADGEEPKTYHVYSDNF